MIIDNLLDENIIIDILSDKKTTKSEVVEEKEKSSPKKDRILRKQIISINGEYIDV